LKSPGCAQGGVLCKSTTALACDLILGLCLGHLIRGVSWLPLGFKNLSTE
jgi:hypothetical protein